MIPPATVAAAPTESAAVSEEEAACPTATDADAGFTCPICLSPIQVGEKVRRCPSCDMLHHYECWLEVGGCGTFGCGHAPVIEKAEESLNARNSAWGDTKECPICGEKIKSIALRCRYCNTTFDSVDPMSVADLRRQASAQDQLQTARIQVIVLFVLSIMGCLAPVMLVVSLAYMVHSRIALAKCGPLFVIMGWAAVGLSGLYSLLMLAFFLLSG